MANIINFNDATKGKVTTLEVIKGNHSIYKCGHGNIELHVDERKVRCRACGEEIDPFDALLEFADKERRFLWEVAAAKLAIEEFEKIKSEWSLTLTEKRRIGKVRTLATMGKVDYNDLRNELLKGE